jgi:hypothetical protein
MPLPDPERSQVVLIGTSLYEDEKLPPLPTVASNISGLASVLTDSVYGLVPEDHCTVLTDEHDISLVGRKLRLAAKKAEDLLLVYYAGHGIVSGRRHDLYLALSGSEWAEPEFSALEYEKLRSAVLDSRAATKVIILDCCFSGRVVSDTMADPVTQAINQAEVDGTYVLASAQRDQVALVLPGEEHTAFTGRLLRLIHEGIPGGPELLTIDDFYRQLLATMNAEGLSKPQRRTVQSADLLALARNRAFAETAAPLLRQRQAAAAARGEAGNWQEAAELLREILAEQERILGADHPDALHTRQFWAHALGGAGDPIEAAALLRKLLAEQTRVLGPENEDTLRTRQFLAVNVGEAGYRDEAIAILRVLVPDRRRILGSEDEQTLRSGHVLARNLALIGEMDEATALLKEIVAARERVLGADHPHTTRATRDLAALLEPNVGERNV